MPSGNPLDCNNVSPECPVEDSIYGYYPSVPANAFFLALFAICLGFNLLFGIRYKTWTYMLAMGLGCLAEVIGYVGRILLHNNPFGQVGFEMQICCLIIAPAFNSAAIYLTLKHIALAFGPEWSRLRPKYYTWIFITFDLLALTLQGAGGGIAATSNNNDNLRNVGDDLMMTGISWQVATLLIFGVIVVDYIIRRWKDHIPLSKEASATIKDRKFRLLVVALVIAYLAVFTRCVYRIAEMSGGWRNPIMQTERLFIGIESWYVRPRLMLRTSLTDYLQHGCSGYAAPDFLSPRVLLPSSFKIIRRELQKGRYR